MKIERLSFFALLALVLVTPLIYVSPSVLAPDYIKMFFVVFCAFISAGALIFLSWKHKSVLIPKHPSILALLVIDIITALSAVVAGTFKLSFFGQGVGVDALSTIFLATLVLLLVVMTSRTIGKLLTMYGAIIVSFTIILLYQGIRLFAGPGFLSFGIFDQVTSTFVGRWHEIAIFGALVLILLTTALEYLKLRPLIRTLIIIGSVLTVGLMTVSGFSALWLLVALSMIGIIVVKYISTRTFAFYALIVCVLASVFVWGRVYTIDPVLKHFNIVENEIHLPWQSTLDVAVGTIKDSPLFGAGPGQFSVEYNKYKPAYINNTIAWALNFFYGSGLIPTFAVTTGIVGFAAWIAFLWIFLRDGFVSLRRRSRDEFVQYVTVSSFFAALFMWLTAFIYVPSLIFWLLTFVMTGIYIRASLLPKVIEGKSESETYTDSWLIRWDSTGRSGLIATITTIVILILGLIWAIGYIRITVAQGYFQSGIALINSATDANAVESISAAENKFTKAISWNGTDTYARALASAFILDFQNAFAQKSQGTTTLSAADTTAITQKLQFAATAAGKAIALSPDNYMNYLSQASTAEIFAEAKADKAYEGAIQLYQKAAALSPLNPSIYYSAALFEARLAHDDIAQRYFNMAIQMKPNYADAIVQFGFLLYRNKSYENASTAFKAAINVAPNYQGIHYYSGLTLARLGKSADAIAELELAVKASPNEQVIQQALDTLKAGKIIFSDAPELKQPVSTTSTKTIKPPTTKTPSKK